MEFEFETSIKQNSNLFFKKFLNSNDKTSSQYKYTNKKKEIDNRTKLIIPLELFINKKLENNQNNDNKENKETNVKIKESYILKTEMKVNNTNKKRKNFNLTKFITTSNDKKVKNVNSNKNEFLYTKVKKRKSSLEKYLNSKKIESNFSFININKKTNKSTYTSIYKKYLNFDGILCNNKKQNNIFNSATKSKHFAKLFCNSPQKYSDENIKNKILNKKTNKYDDIIFRTKNLLEDYKNLLNFYKIK